MQAIIAHLTIQPQFAQEYEAQFAANAANVLKNEPGVFLYQLTKDPKTPGAYTVLELYENKRALKTHFQNMPKGQPNYMDGRPELVIMPVTGTPVFRRNIIARGESSVGIVAKFVLKPNTGSAFFSAFANASKGVEAKEQGTHLYAVGEDPKNPGNCYVMELYKNKQATVVHSKMNHFQMLMASVGSLMAKKPSLKYLIPVGKTHSESKL